ncbi:MAG: hypothetical protein AYK19_04395 [Theionarchaea archaeon DG-70-1]|nr:MAG: hypothetical protein AYK19_04395 [Theionarchaea archaeon DG-70-1]
MDSVKGNPISALSDTERYCPYCGTRLKIDDAFCSNCGKKIYLPSAETQKKSMSLMDLIRKILRLFSFEKKDKIKIFDELLYSNKWNEALEYYNYLKSGEKVPQAINEKVTLIKENLKFPLLIYLDIESDPAVDEIWEIAAVKVRGAVRLGRFHSFVRSSSKIPFERLPPHELNSYRKAPPIEKAIESFDSFLGDQPLMLVGHNIMFDIEKVSSHLKKIVAYPSLDTLPLSRFCWPLHYSHTLSDLMEVKETHRASDDVETNILLIDKIIEKIKSFDYLEKSLLLTLLDKKTASFIRLFLGKIPHFDFSQLKEATEALLSRHRSTHFIRKNHETRVTFFDKIDSIKDKNIFIDIDGYLPREEYYKNILNVSDSITTPLPRNHILNERRYISELIGEKEPSPYVSLSLDALEGFCLYRFWKAFPSDPDSLDLSYRRALLYLILWSVSTRDGVIDPNLIYWVLQSCPDIQVLLQKSTYQNECSPECPLKNQSCPIVNPRTNPNLIFTDFSTAIKLRGSRLIINEVHNLDEYLTEGVTTTISQKDFEALKNELSGQVELTFLEHALQQMEKAVVDFVEKRDLIQQRRFTKRLRILESFQKSNDWKELHEAKNCLIKEISRISDKIDGDKICCQLLTKICHDLSGILPEDYEETEYVTWISIQYSDEYSVGSWSINRTLIDMTQVRETLFRENCIVLVSDLAMESEPFPGSLDLEDNICVITVSGITRESHLLITGHLPRPTRFNVLSFLSNFGELVYELFETGLPMEIISPSYMDAKILSELLKENERIKVVSHPLFESRRRMLSYTRRLLEEENTNFIFIDTIRNMRRKDITSQILLIERVPFPNFFDPVTSARLLRLIKSAEDYERVVIPEIAAKLNEIITYAHAVSEGAVITDLRFSTGYYAGIVNRMLSKNFRVYKDEDQFFFALEKVVHKRHSKNLERLHHISDKLKEILAKEGLAPEIDLSAIDSLSYLKTFFGFDEFKPKQREVIEHIFAHEDVFAVMPTGYGKSLCYQIPAIAFSVLMEGLTVIISPLQALMRDQVQNLHNNGVLRAAYINSSLSVLERNDRLKGIQNGWYDIVYISPEQLRNRKTRDALASREISLFVIDEAHCLSQWGHDFRPDYFYIPQFIEELPQRPTIAAFTATATQKVIADVCKALEIRSPPFTSEVTRKNLNLYVEKIETGTSLDVENVKRNLLLEYLASQGKGKSGIIYCTYTRTTEELCYFLKANAEIIGRTPDEIEYFHGKMDGQRKMRVQDGFMGKGKVSQISLITATNAFGMGIDKDDIHFIIHYDIPGSIETFYQEIGRAGRDESIHADCLLLYWKGDLEKQRKLVTIVTERDLIAIHEKLKQYGLDESQIYVSEDNLANDTGMDTTTVRVAISQLEKNGYVKRGTNAWRTMTLRLAALPEPATTDQEKLISALDLNAGWKTIHIDVVASNLRWTVNKTEDELETLLTSDPPVLQERKEVQGTISDHPENDLNSTYGLQEELLRYLMNRSHEFEAGHWTSIYSREWGQLAAIISSNLSIAVYPTMCREVIYQWHKQNLISLHEGISKTSLILRSTPEDIFAFLRKKKEIDLLLLRELVSCSENGSFSFNISDISSRIKMHRFELRDSLLRLHIFQVISLKRIQNTGNCMTLRLQTPHPDVRPHDVVLRPKDLDLEDLRKLQLEKETKIKIIRKYAEKTDFSEERWQFLEDYFRGDIEIELPELQEITKGLNERQVEVVTSPAGYLLVNAGAGTGKTLTVARRILYATEMLGVPSFNILALTFSRSGVRQLREKVKQVMPMRKIDVRTYHSLAYQILWQHVGEPPLWVAPGFEVQAIDRLIYNFKPIVHKFADGLPSEGKLKLYQYAIEKLQSEREPVFPEDIKDTNHVIIERSVIKGVHLKELYSAYLDYLKSNNLIDFGFMLSQVVHLFKSRPDVLQYYQRRVNYIIVDEYQDTTPVQDELLRLLSDWYGNLTVVGDNDQNIFAWNFADVENILKFDKRYSGTRVVNLERNYRSTKKILDVSNESIIHNQMRIPKNLYPYREDTGAPVKVYYTESKDDIGADYIIKEIKRIQDRKTYGLHEIAVLTKTGAQQTAILDALQSADIPASSPEEEIKMLRSSPASHILEVMKKISEENPDITAYNCYVEALHALKKEHTTTGIADFVREFEDSAEDSSASAFIQYARSVSKSDFRSKDDRAVNVLTIHKSKGLEFKVVFVTHLRRSSFPMWKGDVEEERRVFYVALTRAMDTLYLIGSTEKSKFIGEIEHLLASSEITENIRMEETQEK